MSAVLLLFYILVNLTTVSVAQNIQRQIKVWYLNNELEMMWKEAVVA
jgi:hypothetical protein